MMSTSQYYDLWKTIAPNADLSIIKQYMDMGINTTGKIIS